MVTRRDRTSPAGKSLIAPELATRFQSAQIVSGKASPTRMAPHLLARGKSTSYNYVVLAGGSSAARLSPCPPSPARLLTPPTDPAGVENERYRIGQEQCHPGSRQSGP